MPPRNGNNSAQASPAPRPDRMLISQSLEEVPAGDVLNKVAILQDHIVPGRKRVTRRTVLKDGQAADGQNPPSASGVQN